MSGALPDGACDCHCHVFGPAARFPYAEPRSYTPDDAPLEAYLALLDRLGFDRGVLVQPSAYGRDNRAMLDALMREPRRLRGVAVGGGELSKDTLRQWHALWRARVAGERIPARRQTLLPERRRLEGGRAVAAAALPNSAGICSSGSMRAICQRWLPRCHACRCRWWSITWGGWNTITAPRIPASRRCYAASAKEGCGRSCPAPIG